MKRKQILWLTSWYPNKLEPLSGDFIERHAKAASLLNDITVIHVVKDNHDINSARKTVIINKYKSFPSLTSYKGYYTSPGGTFFSSFISLLKHFKLQKQLIKQYVREYGKPDLIHVHICFKAGIGALYCRWRYGIRYIVSEQWTIFCPEAKPSFGDQSFIIRWFIRQIYKGASATSAVSTYLARSISGRFSIVEPLRIPNVVDTKLFFPSSAKYDVFTFIHISVLNYQKSPDEIILAIDLLRQKTNRPFQLIIYGPFVKELADKIKDKNTEQYIQYRREVMQDELSAEVRKCHALLLYSRFETFGCVVIESFASGIPVIVSDIPVMRELVEENVTGIFASPGDPEKLAEKMLWMMENYKSFDPGIISRTARDKYEYFTISEKFDWMYRGVVGEL
ncbi:MAG TPA: glycosyltransferase [Flavitalea sp.]|nr:glycosyltransferase [Flavitalea sp.]